MELTRDFGANRFRCRQFNLKIKGVDRGGLLFQTTQVHLNLMFDGVVERPVGKLIKLEVSLEASIEVV